MHEQRKKKFIKRAHTIEVQFQGAVQLVHLLLHQITYIKVE